jgi:hypothetical protein
LAAIIPIPITAAATDRGLRGKQAMAVPTTPPRERDRHSIEDLIGCEGRTQLLGHLGNEIQQDPLHIPRPAIESTLIEQPWEITTPMFSGVA